MIYIVGKDKPYYTQRNNKLNPYGTCNVTSMVMALSYLDYEFPPFCEYEQPEDRLYNFILNDPDCIKYRDDFVIRNKWAEGIPPMQIHDVLSWCTNKWMNRRVTQFYGSLSIQNILTEIKDGRPVVISGTFPRPGKTPLGHIVVLSGYNEETREVCYDDPYGTTYDWDKGGGKNCWVSWDLFIRDIKEPCHTAAKMAHVFFEKICNKPAR